MVLRHVQEANTLVNRQNIRYNILSGTLVPYRAINRHNKTCPVVPYAVLPLTFANAMLYCLM